MNMNLDKISIEVICQSLWDVEREFDLLDFEVDGVKVWQYMRMPIYYHVAERAGVFLAPHVKNDSRLSKFTQMGKYLFGALLHNPFLKRSKVDEVVIEHPRSAMIKSNKVDIYSCYYVQELQRCGIPYLRLDRADLNSGHRKAYDPARSYIDTFPILVKLTRLLRRTRLTNEQRATLKAVSEKLSREFDTSLNLEALLVPAVLKFNVNYRLYRALFKRLKPKRLVVVVSYAYGDAIRAAKDLGIETVEIQHGTFSRYHLGYSYPGKVECPDYFPDTFMAWGSFWRDMGVLPLASEAIQVTGFPYFNSLRDNYTRVDKNENQVVVLSQGALGAKIADQIYAMREALSDFEIIYKLHPGEFARWQDYESLRKLAEQPNVRIIKEANLYELLARSRYQIGVFSTAIYEGIGFGCTTLLLDLPGVEYMTDLIDEDLAVLIKDKGDLSRALSENKINKNVFDAAYVFGQRDNLLP